MPEAISHHIYTKFCFNNNEKPAFPPKPEHVFPTQTFPLNSKPTTYSTSPFGDLEGISHLTCPKLNTLFSFQICSSYNTLYLSNFIFPFIPTDQQILSALASATFHRLHFHSLVEVTTISHLDYCKKHLTSSCFHSCLSKLILKTAARIDWHNLKHKLDHIILCSKLASSLPSQEE